MDEICQELRKSVEKCLEIGIKSDKLIVDPGLGFGKRASHNLEILQHLNRLSILRCPILTGPSRKSFIGVILGGPVRERIWGTAAAVSASILHGAHIVRVHDVREMADVAKVTDAVLNYTTFQNL